MSNTLRNRIVEFAAVFANQVIDAIKTASLTDIMSDGGGTAPARAAQGRPRSAAAMPAGTGTKRAGRPPKHSADDVAHVVTQLVALLKKHEEGLRAEQIRTALNVPREQLTKPINTALASRSITKKGQKRATTYFAR